VSLFDAEEEGEHRYRETADSLRRLRAALLADLLSGDHEIPACYDVLLSA
jgi:hypothetical protein